MFSASLRPEDLQLAAPVSITFSWADRDNDGLVDRGTCNGGADAGQTCDHDADCSGSTCSSNTNLAEASLVLNRNSNRFGKGGFGSSPFSCSSHLGGACATTVAKCGNLPGTGKATVANCSSGAAVDA